MLAENVDEYLAPIYASHAKYIICMLSEYYPRKVWTVFESEQEHPRMHTACRLLSLYD